MTTTIADIMTKNPVRLRASASVTEAARHMREQSVGAILVEDDNGLCGIVTDRDIAVRVVAQGDDPGKTSLESVCSKSLATLSPQDQVDHAIELMRKKGIRRIPIENDGKVVGIISLGDLALSRDPKSALGGISSHAPNV